MRVFIFILVVLSVIGSLVASEKLGGGNGTSKIQKRRQSCGSHYDNLIKELVSQSWEDDKVCLDQILYTIDNAKNATLWALWVLDSMQLPVGQLYGSRNHLGNYDQCLSQKVGSSRTPYHTQYCLAGILLQYNTVNISPDTIDPFGSADAYVKSMSVLEQRFNEMNWGLCMPSVCQAKSVEKFARALLKQSHLGYLQSPDNVTINCEIPQPASVNSSTIFFMSILLTTLTVVACTVYASTKQTKNPPSYVDGLIRCFCLKRNAKEFTARPKNDVNALHGMRFISCALIVLVHVIFGIYTVTPANGLDFEEKLLSYGQNLLMFLIVVDTFFIMSGLLFIRNVKKESTIQDLIEALIKRYFRLIWWYLANVIIILILPKSGCGPLCSKYVNPEKEVCQRTWWLGLLMMSNYYDVFSVCAPVSWYIFCDFQITVVASIVYWIYQRHKRVGTTCFAVLTLLSVIIPGYVAYYENDISMIPIKFDMFKIMRNKESDTMLMHLYMKTQYRANPYLMGMIMGYVMSNYTAEQITKFLTKKRVSYVMLGLALALISTSVLFLNGGESLKNALLLSLHRPFWALLVCAIIGVCEYGSFPIVKDVLTWKVFVPLSKLTYGIYMIHFTTIVVNLVSTRSTLHFSAQILIEKYLAHLTIAAIISLYFMLFVESPLNNVVKMVLAKRGSTNLKIPLDSLVKNGGNTEAQNGGDKTQTNDVTTDLSQSGLKLKKL